MNLMAAVFGVFGVLAVYSLIERMTGSRLGAWVGGGVLAFTPLFWWQTVAAEVYALHIFFVALMMRVLWEWEEKRAFSILVVFALVTGLSFGNHLQTVMLAPGVFYLILSGDRKVLLDGKRFLVLTLFFMLPLLVYLYLPIRTWAGAGIHWGDPDSWGRFWAHVSGRSHRGGYVFNLGFWGYVERLKGSLGSIWDQFGVMGWVGVGGWCRIRLVRWRVFFVGVVVFDLFYTVFLNTISLEITPFNLSVCLVLAIGIGVGVADVVKRCERYVSDGVMRGVKFGCGVVPGMFLLLNFGVSDQSRNYTAYEHALNIFRTTEYNSVIFINGDNHLFPVIYARLVERMREDATLYDRLNLIFKMPQAAKGIAPRTETWEEKRNAMEKSIITASKEKPVYYAVFGPYAVEMPSSYSLVQKGILYEVVKDGGGPDDQVLQKWWSRYAVESIYEPFEKDFMNREICAYFFFDRGKALILTGQASAGLKHMKLAREVGYDDNVIHSEMAVFLTDHGFFEEARLSLERALRYHEDLSGVYNNWGYYYHKFGKYEEAVMSFRKAVDLKPERYGFLNNLAFALFEAGHTEDASRIFERSLSLKKTQPGIRKFMKEKGLVTTAPPPEDQGAP